MATPVAPPAHVPVGDRLTAELVARLVAQCTLACETGAEGPIADDVASRHAARGDVVTRIGHSLVVTAPRFDPASRGGRPLVVLAGHLDVVAPTEDDRDPRVEVQDGVEVVVGRGTSDMKAGNVVAGALFEAVADGDLATDADVVLVLYAGEEGPDEGNELPDVLDTVEWLADADLAVILEPTDGELQLGCVGGLHATLTVHGAQAHSARPWQGSNAATRAGFLLAAFDELAPLAVPIGDVTFHDVWSVTQVTTSNGRNVIPGHVDINLNFRFSPSRDLATAEHQLRDVVTTMAGTLDLSVDIAITDRAEPAPPGGDDPLVARLRATAEAPVAAKQAWTDVARFAPLGVPAVNFGPGRTDQAHQRGEFVESWRLRAVHDSLAAFLSSLAGERP